MSDKPPFNPNLGFSKPAFDPGSPFTKIRTSNERKAMHPDITAVQRLILKNFGSNPEAMAGYLEKRGFETQIRGDGVWAKKPGEAEFSPLDPQRTLLDIAEDAMSGDLFKSLPKDVSAKEAIRELSLDLGDMGWDVGAGGITAAATAMGGIGGALTPVPGGAYIGASTMGGGTAAGLEYGKQRIGQELGIPQEIDPSMIGVAGGTGALSPLLLGTGAQGIKSIGGKALTEAQRQSQRSLLTRLTDKLAPPVVGSVAKIPDSAIKGYWKYTPEIDDAIKSGDARPFARKLHGEITSTLYGKKRAIGQALADKTIGSKNMVFRDDVFDPIEQQIKKLVASDMSKTKAGQKEIEALRNFVDDYKEGLPDILDAETTWTLKNKLWNLKETYAMSDDNTMKQIAGSIGKASKKADDLLVEAADNAGLKKEYQKISEVEKYVDKYYGDEEKTYRTISGIEMPSREFPRGTLSDLDIDFKPMAEKIEGYHYFRDLSRMPGSRDAYRGPIARPVAETTKLAAKLKSYAAQSGEKAVSALPNVVQAPLRAVGRQIPKAPAIASPWIQIGTRDWLDQTIKEY